MKTLSLAAQNLTFMRKLNVLTALVALVTLSLVSCKKDNTITSDQLTSYKALPVSVRILPTFTVNGSTEFRADGDTTTPTLNVGDVVTITNKVEFDEYVSPDALNYTFFTLGTSSNLNNYKQGYLPKSTAILDTKNFSWNTSSTLPEVKLIGSHRYSDYNPTTLYDYSVTYKYTIPASLSGKTVSISLNTLNGNADPSSIAFVNYPQAFRVK